MSDQQVWQAYGSVRAGGRRDAFSPELEAHLAPKTPKNHAWLEPPFEENELHNGVASVEVRIHCYGDDGGNSCFVHVWGVDKEGVEAAMKRARLLVESGHMEIVMRGEQ